MSEKSINKMFLLLKIVLAAFIVRSNREFYDRISAIYDRLFTSHAIHIEKIVNLLKSVYYEKNITILDLGCGTGMLAKALKNQNFRVIGFDISYESLCVLEKSNLKMPLIQGCAESLTFSDNSFDVLVCLGVWRHFKKMEGILDEIHRVLRKDAVFIMGYFPPKLGGIFYIPGNFLGRIMALIYETMVNRLGYIDHVNVHFEQKTLQAIGKRFARIRKIDSGKHYYLVLATKAE
jgi:ubiquinone/menaquinone biosynthesis C-methylase UbiE